MEEFKVGDRVEVRISGWYNCTSKIFGPAEWHKGIIIKPENNRAIRTKLDDGRVFCVQKEDLKHLLDW